MKYPKLKVACVESGIPQVKAAQILGRDPAWLSRVIHGWVEPTDAERKKLSRIVGVPVDELFPEN